jgi:hypothetical protein
MQEALEKIFDSEGVAEASPSQLKVDYRKLRAVYICCADGNETACVRFESTTCGLCKYKLGDSCFNYSS